MASVILFMPASIILWMISPYIIRMRLHRIEDSWNIIWKLYALSTFWSIAGTFLWWFVLIPLIWTTKILISLSIVLFIVSQSISFKENLKFNTSMIVILIALWLTMDKINAENAKRWFVDIDTEYNRIWIRDYTEWIWKDKIRYLHINNENSSSMYLEKDELVAEYTKYYHLARFFNPWFKKTMMLWWAWYSFPKDFTKKYEKSTIDVVEIDPEITNIAKKYFSLKDNPRLKSIHADWRVYLNNTKERYDVIFGDAFSSHFSLPFQLTTKEAVQKKYDILNQDWVVILNVISAINWAKWDFLRAEVATYKSIFPSVLVIPVKKDYDWEEIINIMIVASKKKLSDKLESKDKEIDWYLKNIWKKPIPSDIPVITDEYAPIDYYTREIKF